MRAVGATRATNRWLGRGAVGCAALECRLQDPAGPQCPHLSSQRGDCLPQQLPLVHKPPRDGHILDGLQAEACGFGGRNCCCCRRAPATAPSTDSELQPAQRGNNCGAARASKELHRGSENAHLSDGAVGGHARRRVKRCVGRGMEVQSPNGNSHVQRRARHYRCQARTAVPPRAASNVPMFALATTRPANRALPGSGQRTEAPLLRWAAGSLSNAMPCTASRSKAAMAACARSAQFGVVPRFGSAGAG